jgi:hypothetical protein
MVVRQMTFDNVCDTQLCRVGGGEAGHVSSGDLDAWP